MEILNKKTKERSLGELGENIAENILIKSGYRIIERNYWTKFGEIDIVAISPDGTLAFIEVKTMRQSEYELVPEDQYSASKRQKTVRICQVYANGNPKLIDDNKGWRMDLIAIQVPHLATEGDELTALEKSCVVNYYENV